MDIQGFDIPRSGVLRIDLFRSADRSALLYPGAVLMNLLGGLEEITWFADDRQIAGATCGIAGIGVSFPSGTSREEGRFGDLRVLHGAAAARRLGISALFEKMLNDRPSPGFRAEIQAVELGNGRLHPARSLLLLESGTSYSGISNEKIRSTPRAASYRIIHLADIVILEAETPGATDVVFQRQ